MCKMSPLPLLLLLLMAAMASGSWSRISGDICGRAELPGLRLRGGGSAFAPSQGGAGGQRQQQRPAFVKTVVEEVQAGESKPNLKREESRLVLSEAMDVNATETLEQNATEGKNVTYVIDGVEVSAEEYGQRVKSVSQRALENWIVQSDCGGLKEGDVLVPDMCESVPEAVSRVAHNGTVYVRKGYYFWDGVLVVQKHMHIRGEPNPDEGPGTGRPTMEGRWLLGEKSSGSFKHVNCIAKFSKEGQQEQHGKML